ncbi:MAG: hemerythrin domain-containing protein [Lachnospiraceae bacterium]|nr:hemerythrin domain-containing protein [Lachnospiraceae bacterium]
MIRFTKDCVLGVEEIDKEHEHLFKLFNDAITILEYDYGEDKYYKIHNILSGLDQYAENHFMHEEAYMEKICDPELILQRVQHLSFKIRLFEFLVKNIDNEKEQMEALRDLIDFLSLWLYRHIISSDTMIGKLPPLEEWMLRENPCEYIEEYITGVDIIDREHRILFETLERAFNLVKFWVEGDSYDEIIHILDELKVCTVTHFADEEEHMQSIGYEGYEAHKQAHDAYVDRLDEIDFDKIEENPKIYLESLIEFLMGWMIHHITNFDKNIPLI